MAIAAHDEEIRPLLLRRGQELFSRPDARNRRGGVMLGDDAVPGEIVDDGGNAFLFVSDGDDDDVARCREKRQADGKRSYGLG